MFSRKLSGIACACAMRSPFSGPSPRRRAPPSRGSRSPPSPRPSLRPFCCRPRRTCRAGCGSRRPRGSRGAARIGRDMRARLRDEHRRAARDRVLPARRDERPVGAAARAPPAASSRRRARRRARRTPPTRARPARRRRTRGRRRCSDRRSAAAARSASARRRRPPRSAPTRAAPRASRPAAPRRPAAAPAGGSVSTIPTASGVGSSSTRPSASSRSTRSAGVAWVPTSQVQAVRPRARRSAWISARTSSTSSAAQAEALRDVPAGLVAAAHPEHVAVGDDPLVRRAERRVRVGVLGELDQRARRSSQAEILAPTRRGRRSSDARRARRTRASPRTGSAAPFARQRSTFPCPAL